MSAFEKVAYDHAYHSLDRAGDLSGRTLVILRGVDMFWTALATPTRGAYHMSTPERLITLATGLDALEASPPAANTLHLRTPGAFQNAFLDSLLRHELRPFRAGDRVELKGVGFEIGSVDQAGRPTAIVVTFAASLETADFAWVVWTDDGYQPLTLPAVGSSTKIPAVDISKLAGYRYRPGS